jgi:hypothetical protein
MSDTEIPRRIRLDLFQPAELAIYNAIQEVEKMPADVRLTDAVILLGKAKDCVSNYIESEEETEQQPEGKVGNTLHTYQNRDKLYSFLYSVTGKHTKEVQWMVDEILKILEPRVEEGNKEKEEEK